jgi:hypothetical protein
MLHPRLGPSAWGRAGVKVIIPRLCSAIRIASYYFVVNGIISVPIHGFFLSSLIRSSSCHEEVVRTYT